MNSDDCLYTFNRSLLFMSLTSKYSSVVKMELVTLYKFLIVVLTDIQVVLKIIVMIMMSICCRLVYNDHIIVRFVTSWWSNILKCMFLCWKILFTIKYIAIIYENRIDILIFILMRVPLSTQLRTLHTYEYIST